MQKRILCYGDSNTWGYMPDIGTRYAQNIRWPGIVSNVLGNSYEVVEDSISGRTTIFDDPYISYRNGKIGLGYALAAHAPLDLVILSLGTNDLKYVDAIASYKGLDELLRLLENADSCFPLPGNVQNFPNGLKVLVISPIHLHPQLDTLRPESSFRGKHGESLKFAQYYKKIVEAHGAYFLDAAEYAEPSMVDCVHMSPASHRALGNEVVKKVKEIFANPNEMVDFIK